MQNSGLGNAVNPLASLMDPAVYGLPCLLVIGWRGEPGVHDEPQHVKQGEITLSQLDVLGLPWRILSPDTEDGDFRVMFAELAAALRQGRCAALVVRKGALTTDCRPRYGQEAALSREQAVSLVLEAVHPRDVLVSTTGKLSRELFELRESRGEGHGQDFLTVGSMGHASMIALQIAAEKKDRTVWCLDGDGACLMHLGALPLIGQRKPSNFLHVVMNNGAHETVGGMPVCGGGLDLASLALASGYRKALPAPNGEALRAALREAREAPVSGPVMIVADCACGARANLGRPTATPVQNRDALMRVLQA